KVLGRDDLLNIQGMLGAHRVWRDSEALYPELKIQEPQDGRSDLFAEIGGNQDDALRDPAVDGDFLVVVGVEKLRHPRPGVSAGVGLVEKLLIYLADVFFREAGAIGGVLKRLPSKVAARVVELVFNKNERALLVEGEQV